MNKYFFIPRGHIERIFFILIVLWFLGFYSTFVGLLILLAIYLFLFRRRVTDIHERKFVGRDILIAPVTGHVKRVKESHILFSSRFYHGYGLYFPTVGEIEKSEHIVKHKNFLGFLKLKAVRSEITLKTKLDFHIKLIVESGYLKPNHQIFVDIGDKGTVGALMGYLPFGPKVVIEINQNLTIAVKEGDLITSTQTVIANTKEN